MGLTSGVWQPQETNTNIPVGGGGEGIVGEGGGSRDFDRGCPQHQLVDKEGLGEIWVDEGLTAQK